MIKDSTVKTILDLKSEKFPGCQIFIYVNIQLLDPLPEKGSGKVKPGAVDPNQTLMGSQYDATTAGPFDANQNAFDMKKAELLAEIKELNESKIRLEQEQERLIFQKKMAESELVSKVPELLLAKTNTKKDITAKIDKYAKQESIIIKVL